MIKILFVCGCLEPGKNGVGDYTLRLASELIKNGIPVALLALSDCYVKKKTMDAYEYDDKKIYALRLSKKLSRNEQLVHARDWILQLDPEWLSLQYVPHSYHQKGFPFFLKKFLLKIGYSRKWHIMFHELRVGMNKKCSLKFRLFGYVQEMILYQIINALNPERIHTHSQIYRFKLESMGCKTETLPLFGNIQFCRELKKDSDSSTIIIGVFGSIQPKSKLNEFIAFLKSNAISSIRFHFLGGNGAQLSLWKETLKTLDIDYRVFGWLDENDLSKELSNCTFGITSTPFFFVEKSGTVAAMIEHRLKVVCIGEDWIPNGLDDISIQIPVIQFNSGLKIEELLSPYNDQNGVSLNQVSKKFISDLQLK